MSIVTPFWILALPTFQSVEILRRGISLWSGYKMRRNTRRKAGLGAVLSVKALLDRLSLRHCCLLSHFRRILYPDRGTIVPAKGVCPVPRMAR
jgi:hypothetical protein